MIRTLLAVLILTIAAVAQTGGVPGQPKPLKADQIGGNDGTTLRVIKTDASGQIIVSPTSGASSTQVQGTAASGATAVGNPVQIGGIFNTTPATLTNGQQGVLQMDNAQLLLTKIQGMAATGAAPSGNPVYIAGKNNSGNVQPIATDANGLIAVASAFAATDGMAYNPTGQIQGTTGGLNLGVDNWADNGATWDKIRTQSSTNSGNASQKGVQLADVPGQWAVFLAPAAATQATIGQSAVASVKHVAKSVTVCISAVAAQPDIIFNLRDGATGAGTIKWTARLSATAGTSQCQSANFTIIGTTNTAMTLESAAAPAATNFATVSISGYDIP